VEGLGRSGCGWGGFASGCGGFEFLEYGGLGES